MSVLNALTDPFYRYLPTHLADLALAMVWGQKEALDPQIYNAFRQTGLIHLLVLSGQNITLLSGVLCSLLSRFGKRLQILGLILVSLLYICLFPTEPPIIRAAIMAILGSIVIILEHTTANFYILPLAAVLMVILEPRWLTSLSFWLSMSATGGIVLFYSSLFILISRSKKLQRLPKEIKQILALTLSAQIFTTPLLLIFFREYPLLSIPINLVVSFFVEPIMVFGILLSLLSLLGPIITFPLSLILFGLLQTLLTIISWLGHLSALFVLRI